jgi:hypothetical protein
LIWIFFDFQPVNQNRSKKYRGKVWKSVDLFTNVVSLPPVLARKMPIENEQIFI